MRNYIVEIVECSKELGLRDKIKLKDLGDATSLDRIVDELAVNGERQLIDVDFYGILNVHNENSRDKDYKKYVIVDKDGSRYHTGSESFWNSFMDIYSEVIDAGETEFSIECYKKPSKNYENKSFLTCTIA